MMQYNFFLKNHDQRSYREFTWFLFFLHIVAAGVIGSRTADKDIRTGLYILLGIYAVIFLVYYFMRERKRAFEYFSLVMAVLYGSFWLKHVGVVALLLFLAVYFFVTAVQQKKVMVQCSTSGVHVRKVFNTVVFNWDKIDNVVLKDNLLTIDLKSNKLIQVEVVTDNINVTEEEFNSFCQYQLNKKTAV